MVSSAPCPASIGAGASGSAWGMASRDAPGAGVMRHTACFAVSPMISAVLARSRILYPTGAGESSPLSLLRGNAGGGRSGGSGADFSFPAPPSSGKMRSRHACSSVPEMVTAGWEKSAQAPSPSSVMPSVRAIRRGTTTPCGVSLNSSRPVIRSRASCSPAGMDLPKPNQRIRLNCSTSKVPRKAGVNAARPESVPFRMALSWSKPMRISRRSTLSGLEQEKGILSESGVRWLFIGSNA